MFFSVYSHGQGKWDPKSWVVPQLVRQLVHTMFITNNHASFHLWWKENLVKYQKVSKYYVHHCRHIMNVMNLGFDLNFSKMICEFSALKLVPAIFYQIFIFFTNDSPSKTLRKSHFVLEIFKFLYFFLFPSTFSRFKRTNGSGIINDGIGLHKFE